jgi:hypothetical protein
MDIKKITALIQHSRFNSLIRIMLLCLVIGIGIGGYALYRALNPIAYIATKDDFKIVFPGTPTVHSIAATKDSGGGTESGTIYDVVDNSGAKSGGYIIYVNHYSGQSTNDLSKAATQTALESDAEQIALIDKATIGQHEITTFDNLIAVTATLMPASKSSGSTQLLAFLHKNDAYVLLGAGVSQARFNSFTASFQFLN